MSKLSRESMENIIRVGGSVMFEGRIITDVKLLPTEAELAQGDESRERAAIAQLQAQKNELERQLALLQNREQGPAADPAVSPSGDDKKTAPVTPADQAQTSGPAADTHKTDPSAAKTNDPKAGAPRK